MNYKRNMYKRRGMSHRNDCSSNYTRDSRDCCAAADRSRCMSYCAGSNYPSLAMVYSVNQCWKDINDGSEGFERGTIFSELNKPFMGDKCKNGGCRK